MKKLLLLTGAVLSVGLSSQAQSIIANWTFETSIPTTAGPFNPEVGTGSASSSHAGTTTYSSPAGNGSAHSFSANTWAVGDYYQYQVSTLGYTSGTVTLSFDQTGSSTGPKTFQLKYSTDGSTFTDLGSTYSVLQNGLTPNASWNSTTASSAYTFAPDLSSVSSLLLNQSSVYFRVVDAATTSIGNGTVAAGGTDRMDNVVIGVVPVPEPTTLALVVSGIAGLGLMRRRN